MCGVGLTKDKLERDLPMAVILIVEWRLITVGSLKLSSAIGLFFLKVSARKRRISVKRGAKKRMKGVTK